MADKIRFCKTEMEKAVSDIKTEAENFKNAGATFVNNMQTATAAWEGPSKEKFMKFIDEPVKKYLTIEIPKLVTGLAEMLQSNYDQMNAADREIAGELPTQLV